MLEAIEKLEHKHVMNLIELRRRQKDAAETYSAAIKNNAKLARIKDTALKKFIAAMDDGKMSEVKTEALQLEMLMNHMPLLLESQ